ncbi:hypothetical protein Taro_002675 [Colocasia esculenta]|uniref:Secreted protein n=1 Tax=Colocasia esculenta TaxID=4460 RepID=A0A843TM62_COLES|nr:hypothetical protein [Colocasia esculenta]
MSRVWRVWSLSVFVPWWRDWQWTHWQWSSCVEDGCKQVQAWCSWSSSSYLGACMSRKLREPTCGVAFTGAELLSVEPIEVSLPCCLFPCCWGVCNVDCVCGLMSVRCCALCSTRSTLLLRLSRCFVCRVASLVECCNTYLWLLASLVLAGCELWLRCITWLPFVLVRV